MEFTCSSELWVYPGDAAWVFITLPTDISNEIRDITKNLPRKGFGSVRVTAVVHDVEWKTSIFPYNRSKAYLLPIKKAIRKKAHISPGDVCTFNIHIEDIV